MSPKTILIVEDEGIVALDLQTRLKNVGYHVPAVFSSGEDFLSHWKRYQPDIVLMDIMLKGTLDGIETVNKLKETHTVPVIFLTAYSDGPTFQRGKQTDAYGYLIKPIQTKDLLIALEIAFHRVSLEQEVRYQKNWNQAILDSLSEGVMVINQDYEIIFHNLEAQYLFGIDKMPSHFLALQNQLEPEIFQYILNTREKKVQNFIPETKIKKEIGSSLVELDIKGFSFEGKNSCLLVFRSLTERYEARKTIIQLEEKYKQLFEQHSAGIYITDIQGKIILTNQSFAQMIGFSKPQELKNKTITEFKNIYEFQEIIQKLQQEQQILQYETIYKTKHQELIYCVENFILREEDGVKSIECISIDVTERKKIEEEREQLAAEMLAAMENTDNIVWSVDRNFQLTSYNSAFSRNMLSNFNQTPKLGVTFESIVGNDNQTHDGQEALLWRDLYAKVFMEGRTQMERMYQSPKGYRIYSFYLQPIIKQGVTSGVTVLGIDVTEEKSQEQEKKAFLELINAVYRQSDEMFFLYLSNTETIQDCNQKALDVLNISSMEELKNINVWDTLFSPQDKVILQNQLKKREEWGAEIQLKYQYPYFWGDILIKPLQIPGQSVMLIRIADISKRKEAERAVRTLEMAFKSTSEAILIMETHSDNTSTILFVNQAYTDLTGYESQELIGKNTSIFIVAEVDRSKIAGIAEKFKQMQTFELELLSTRKNGQKYVSSNLFSPIIAASGEQTQQWAIFTRDITDRKKKEALVIENSLHQQKLLLQTIIDTQEEERLNFSEELHDSIGPTLSALKLNFSTLEKYLTTIDGKNTFSFTLELLDAVIQDIRNISHGLMPASLEYLGLVHAINELCKSFKDAVKINFYAYNFDCRVDKSYEITLYRVLQELLNNIIKHAKAQIVDIQLTNLEDVLLLTVEDDGVGFDVTDKSKWKGIGLRNIMNRVQLFGGTFTIDSSPGRGTLTIIEFPITENPILEGDKNIGS